ncbi:unnamed protein product [Rotaria sordida]|uniref:Uncharacterized protein n=1 Tax=Rotaria sordida TaxID=392033 RepID=A0A814XG19_9BILA|nr:unnamed protein product [Rotaria sordida]
MSQSEYMPKSIRNIKEQFDLIFQDTSTEELRTIKCAVYVNKNMGFVVSKLYIKNYFDENAHNQSLKILENIQNSFMDLINQSYWMDDKSKMKAIEKAKTIDKKIAYPDYLVSDNNTKLENDYSAYVFNSSYIHNSFKIHQIKAIENFQFLRKPVLRKVWPSISPTTINAYYDPSQNQISIGTIIGHEITHGFDDTGRQFDKDGNRISWWTNETIEKFNNRKQCFIEQYSNFSVPEINMNSNGNQTQDEDIADNGGLKAAFYAYQKWAKNNVNVDKKLPGLTQYSTEKMFFIHFAHIWCTRISISRAFNRILTDVHSLEHFSNFSVPEINMNSNGNQTQDEDIADNGGLKAAFYAYQKWAKNNVNVDKKLPGLTQYSTEQMFFIHFAHVGCTRISISRAFNKILTDVHSLERFRIIGSTSNFDEFDRVFGCKLGQRNSRMKKCVVW